MPRSEGSWVMRSGVMAKSVIIGGRSAVGRRHKVVCKSVVVGSI